MPVSFNNVCDDVARARNDLDEWMKQFGVESPAS